MSVIAYGKLLTLDVVVTIWGVQVHIVGTVEALDVMRKVRGETDGPSRPS